MVAKAPKWQRFFTIKDFFTPPCFWFEVEGVWTTNLHRFFPGPLKFFGPLLGNIFRIIIFSVMIHLEIVLSVTAVQKYNNEGLIEAFLFLLNFVIYFYILVVMTFYSTQEMKLRKLFLVMNDGFKQRSAPGLTYVTVEPGYQTAKKSLNVWVWSCICTGGSYAILPLVNGSRELPMPAWYPFDIDVRSIVKFSDKYLIFQ